MNTRVLGAILLLVVSAAGLAYIVNEVNLREAARKQVEVTPPVTTTTPSVPVTPPTSPEPKGQITFTSADKVTSVSFPVSLVHDGFVEVDNPTMLNGTTTAFEQTFAWKMVDAKGNIVGEGFGMTHAPDIGIPGPFSVTAFYDKAPATDRGTLIVYEASAKDGSPIHEVKVPIMFLKTAAKGCGYSVNVAFVESTGAHLDCSEVKMVKRSVCATAQSAADVALHELLKGPTDAERANGLTTELQPIVTYPRRTAQGYDFENDLDAGVAGSCRVEAIRAQLAKTITSNGGKAVISINGRTADILQP